MADAVILLNIGCYSWSLIFWNAHDCHTFVLHICKGTHCAYQLGSKAMHNSSRCKNCTQATTTNTAFGCTTHDKISSTVTFNPNRSTALSALSIAQRASCRDKSNDFQCKNNCQTLYRTGPNLIFQSFQTGGLPDQLIDIPPSCAPTRPQIEYETGSAYQQVRINASKGAHRMGSARSWPQNLTDIKSLIEDLSRCLPVRS